MAIFKKRRLKIRWRLLATILPISIIPLFIIVFFMRNQIYAHLEKQKNILNDTLIYQVGQNINNNFNDYALKISSLLSIPEIEDLAYRNKFKDALDERDISEKIREGYGGSGSGTGFRAQSDSLNIPGISYIINRDCYSFNRETPYSYWRAAGINIEPDIGKLFSDPLFKHAQDEVQETFKKRHLKVRNLVMGKLSKSTFVDTDDYVTFILPILNKKSSPDPDSAYFKVFFMLLLSNMGDGGFLPKTISNISGIELGTIYILDYKNDILYTNYGGKSKDDIFLEEEYNIKLLNRDTNILKESDIQKLIHNEYHTDNDEYRSIILDTKYKGIDYQTLYLDQQRNSDIKSGVKIIYFYPKQLIFRPIEKILLKIMIIAVVFILLIIIISIFVSNSLSYPLVTLDNATNRVSQGYLDVDIVSESNDEIGNLYKNFRRMINTINEVLSNIQKSSNNLVGYQNTLDSVINNFDITLKKQAASISESSAIFEELNYSIMQVAQNVKDSLGLTEQAQEHAKLSTTSINEMIEEINKIAETSKEINFITELINGISEKTRLLSLNAAIEASRAGEAGKGFGVVAAEIRKLALQSNQSANEIGSLIKMNEKRIKSGVNKTTEVIEALNNINSSIKMISDIVEQINIAAEEESKGSQVIMDVINTFSEDAHGNLKSIDALGRTRNHLSQEVQKMRNLILGFKLQSGDKQIIRDIKVITKEEKQKLQEQKKEEKKNKEEETKKQEIEKTKKKQKKIIKLDSPKALKLYKEKKKRFK